MDLSDENATLAMLNESKGYYIAINLLKDKQRFELPFGSENKEWKVILSTDAVLNDERALEVLELPERTIAILQQRGC